MPKGNTMQMPAWLAGLILVGIVVVAAMLIPGGPLSTIASGADTPTGGVSLTTLDCPAHEDTLVGAEVVLSIKDNNNQDTRVATTAAVYLEGETAHEFSFTTSASGKAYSNSSNSEILACQSKYKVIAGDGSTYYYQDATDGCYLCVNPVKAGSVPGAVNAPTFVTAKNLKPFSKYVVDKIGTFELKGSNGSVFPVASGALNVTMGVAGKDTDCTLQIKNTVSQTVIRKPIVCFNYNTTAFQSVKVTGGIKASKIPKTVSGYEECWETGIDYLKDTAKATVPLTITAAAGVNPGNETINCKVIDTATRLDQGIIYEDYETLGGGTDIGATDATFSFEVD